jgi:hypothetical protein
MDKLEWKAGEPGWWYYVPLDCSPGMLFAAAWICYLRWGILLDTQDSL